MSEAKTMEKEQLDRNQVIVRTSLIGIITNIFLAGFKAAIGLISNSIAVVLDAVNNLSDALSSVITIAGTKLAGRSPDRKHPLGHGRIEYLTALAVSFIVLYAGVTSLIESVKKIIHPEVADYSAVSLIILAVAISAKLVLGRYVKKKGEETHSASLSASGSDALFDAILSSSVLASAIFFLLTGISLEAWVGVIISGFIIKAGIEMLSDTLSDILGRRADENVSREIKRILNEEPAVRGAYDLFLHNYGPDKDYGSVHLELPDTMTVEEVDELTRRVETRVYCETGVILTGIGVYAYNTKDDEAAHIRNAVQEKMMEHDGVLQVHGFHVDTEKKQIRFDAVMSFDVNQKECLKALYEETAQMYPDYQIQITPDRDISD